MLNHVYLMFGKRTRFRKCHILFLCTRHLLLQLQPLNVQLNSVAVDPLKALLGSSLEMKVQKGS